MSKMTEITCKCGCGRKKLVRIPYDKKNAQMPDAEREELKQRIAELESRVADLEVELELALRTISDIGEEVPSELAVEYERGRLDQREADALIEIHNPYPFTPSYERVCLVFTEAINLYREKIREQEV